MNPPSPGTWAVRLSSATSKVKAELYHFESGQASILIDQGFGAPPSNAAPSGPQFAIKQINADTLLSQPPTKTFAGVPWLIFGSNGVRLVSSSELHRLSLQHSHIGHIRRGSAHSSPQQQHRTLVTSHETARLHKVQSAPIPISVVKDEDRPQLPPRPPLAHAAMAPGRVVIPNTGNSRQAVNPGNQPPHSTPTPTISVPTRPLSSLPNSSPAPSPYEMQQRPDASPLQRQSTPQNHVRITSVSPQSPPKIQVQTQHCLSPNPPSAHSASPYSPSPHPTAIQRPIQQHHVSQGQLPIRPLQTNSQYVRQSNGQHARLPPPPAIVSSPAISGHGAHNGSAQQYNSNLPQTQYFRPAQQMKQPMVSPHAMPAFDGPPQENEKRPGRVKRIMRTPGAKIALRLGSGMLVGGALGSQIGTITDQWAGSEKKSDSAVAMASGVGALARGFGGNDNGDGDLGGGNDNGGYEEDEGGAYDQAYYDDQENSGYDGSFDNSYSYEDPSSGYNGTGFDTRQSTFDPYPETTETYGLNPYAEDGYDYLYDERTPTQSGLDELDNYDLMAANDVYENMYDDQQPSMNDQVAYDPSAQYVYSDGSNSYDYSEGQNLSYTNQPYDNGDPQCDTGFDYGYSGGQQTDSFGSIDPTEVNSSPTADSSNIESGADVSATTGVDEMSAMMDATAFGAAMGPSTLDATI